MTIPEIEVVDAAEDRSRRSRRPVGALVGAAVIAVLVAAVLVVRPGSGDVEIAVDEDDPTTSTVPDTPTPDADSMPAPISLGAPDDGQESVGLPVDADPKTELTDGQLVTVTGAQFPPNESVGVVMCTKEAGQDHGARGVEACDIGHFGQGTTDSEGNLAVEFSVRRFLVFDGQEVDCAAEAGRCIIGMGLLSDYDQSGGVAVDFDPNAAPPAPPTAELSRSDGIRDGETVDLSLTGLVPNSSFFVQQCTERGECVTSVYDELLADADGGYSGPVRLWRQFGSYGFEAQPANVDCAVDACHVEIQGDVPGSRQLGTIPLSFDPDSGSRTAPTMTVLDDGPYSVGSTFRVEISGIRHGDYVEVSVCPTPERGCVAHGSPPRPATGTSVTIEVTIDAVDPACETGCALTAFVHPGTAGPGGGPPPLFPAPIDVLITG